jgi:plastocyanin
MFSKKLIVEHKVMILSFIGVSIFLLVFLLYVPFKEIPTEVTVIKTNEGFVPGEIFVRKGGSVTFKNDSDSLSWPASNSHPEHTEYKGLTTSYGAGTDESCSGSSFDACVGLEKGGEWTFTFEKEGEWYYHDHLAPGLGGSIIVSDREKRSLAARLGFLSSLKRPVFQQPSSETFHTLSFKEQTRIIEELGQRDADEAWDFLVEVATDKLTGERLHGVATIPAIGMHTL